jgi:hypothetical protein
MRRRTLALRIVYSEAIPVYERNLLDALMKPVRFDIFEYIVDEIWNIATNPLRSCDFAPYIQFMVESVKGDTLDELVKCKISKINPTTKNSCQARHIRPPSRIPETLAGHVRSPG